jgi:pyruvate dehydrogenase E2 component (dihydrolipoamide acetyltransferase)
MPEEIVMPRLSDTMQEGTIARWAKSEGDTVVSGDVLMEVETDKATLELTSYHDGTVAQIVVGTGGTAPVGTVVGIIALPGESVDSVRVSTGAAVAAAPAPATATTTAPHTNGAVSASPATASVAVALADASKVKASPLARVLAEGAGLDLRALVGLGSGPGGRIVRADVETAIAAGIATLHAASTSAPSAPIVPAAPVPPIAPTPLTTPVAPSTSGDAFVDEPLSRMRQAIVRGMGIAKPGIPHIYLTIEAEMDAALALRAQVNDATATDPRSKLSVNDLVIKAVAVALRAYPAMNSWYVDAGSDGAPRIRTWVPINIGVAVSLDEGLIVPVIHDAVGKSLGTIAREAKEVYDRVRAGKPASTDLQGATFTVSNLGAYGIEEFAAVIPTPQAGILAVGAAVPRAVVRDGQVVARTMMAMTISADHRVVDGAYAAQFLREIRRVLEHPFALVA